MAIHISNINPYYLRNSGGSIDMGVNGSVTPVEFFKTIPTGRIFELARIQVSIHDASPNPGNYGGGAALTNGVDLFFRAVDGTEYDLLDGRPIKTNDHYNHLDGIDTKYYVAPGATGDDYLSSRISFNKWTTKGEPILMLPGESIVAVINDNLEGLDGGQTIIMHGTEFVMSRYNFHK